MSLDPRAIPPAEEEERANLRGGEKWLGVPVSEISGGINEIARKIPWFTREPFALKNNGHPAKDNPYFDIIVREPLNRDSARIPVGIVSKSYTLLQHETVFERSINAIRAARIDLNKIHVD